jgi:DNA-3-methyladenine glycosylase II
MKTSRIRLRPLSPFRLDLTAWALRRRPRNLIDCWDGERYSRILMVDDRPLRLVVRQTAPSSRPEIECACFCIGHVPSDAQVAAVVQRLLGLNVDTSDFERLTAKNRRLGALVKRFSGFRPPRFPTVFEAAVNAISCQQLSLEAGLELLNRLSSRAGVKFENGGQSFFGPPEPRRLARFEPRGLRALGFSRNKARALLELARACVLGDDPFVDLADIDDQSAMDRLVQLRGIGRWSAEYVLLRGLGRLSVFPGDDVAAAKNLRQWLGIRRERQRFGYDEIHQALEKWAPFQGLVYFHLLLANLAARGWVDSAAPAAVA